MKRMAGVRQRKRNLLGDVEFIAHKAVNSTLSNQFMKTVKENTNTLSAFLGCNRMQAVLFSIICNLNCNNKAVSIEQVADWTECSSIMISGYIDELETLRRKKILRKEATDKKTDSINLVSAINFSVNPSVFEALRKGTPITVQKNRITDNYDLVRTMARLIKQCSDEEITFKEMWRDIAKIESEYSDMELLTELRKMIRDKKERLLYFSLCDEYYNGNLNCDLIPLIRLITPDKREQLRLRLQFSKENSQLSTGGFIKIKRQFFSDEKEINLTDKAVDILIKDFKKIKISIKEEKATDIIVGREIKEKALFFTREEREKHDFLTKLLMHDNHKALTRRLDKSGMKTGVAVLFYGPPGTGKTESVLQLARQTKRDLLQVNISETKSKWFGESEKRIKEVFDRYRKLSEESEIIPILFFNEADGIFSTRKQIGESSVDQTENAIQNIILQEMEDLKGILIATTNMTQNFDKAFDRRFLYKIQFDKPSTEARAHIWKDKIPSLTDAAANQFAETHDLSGG
ncbi:MAG: ATP-binding protein [Bacteroidetes bacterium]|nr:ATP-binding protein [Bacteroidota bacterium]